jgi:hypothetical protein
MFLIVLQEYDNLLSITPFKKYQVKDTPENEMKCLNDAAKDFILQEQGIRRSEEPLRTVAELEKDKDKIEDGFYLVQSAQGAQSAQSAQTIDIYKLSSVLQSGMFYTSIVKTLKPYKRMLIINETDVKCFYGHAAGACQAAGAAGIGCVNEEKNEKLTMRGVNPVIRAETIEKYATVQNELRELLAKPRAWKKKA